MTDPRAEDARRQAGEYADEDALSILKADKEQADALARADLGEPDPKAEDTPAGDETPAAEDKAEDTPQKDAAPAAEAKVEEEKPSAVQARIDELTREKYELQARLKALEETAAKPPAASNGQKTIKDYSDDELRSIASSNPEYADTIREELAERRATRVVETKLREQEEKQQRVTKAQRASVEWADLTKEHPELAQVTSDLYQRANAAYVALFQNAFGRPPTREDAVPGFATAAVAIARKASSAQQDAALRKEKSRVEAVRRTAAKSPLGGDGRGALPPSDDAELRKLEKAAIASGDDSAWQRYMIKKAEIDKKHAKAKAMADKGG